jgi:hypothetical protein
VSVPEFAPESNTTVRSDIREFAVGSASANEPSDVGELTGLLFLRAAKTQSGPIRRQAICSQLDQPFLGSLHQKWKMGHAKLEITFRVTIQEHPLDPVDSGYSDRRHATFSLGSICTGSHL